MTTENVTARPEDQVRRRMLEWKETFEAKDVEGMMAFYAPEGFTGFDLMPPLEFRGGEMWRRNWIGFLGAFEGSPGLEFRDLQVFASGDLSFVRTFTRIFGTMGGSPIDMWVRQTNCFRLVDGEWLMIHDHVSVPADLATGRALTELAPAGAPR
ncbi:YybH family protein [Streptomyces marincola]|nr:nuclear transport factor 2 family protein [Streptomyces marincola]